MKIAVIPFLLFATILCSCQENTKYKEQINTTDTLINALYRNDTAKVSALIGIDPERIGEDIGHFEFKVRGAVKWLKKNGVPPSSSYQIKEYPKEATDLIDVIVPVYKLNSKTEDGKIIVRFVKFLPSNKIAFFQVDSRFIDKGTIGPNPN